MGVIAGFVLLDIPKKSVEKAPVQFSHLRLVGDAPLAGINDYRFLIALYGASSLVSGSESHRLNAGDVIRLRPGAHAAIRGAQSLQCSVCQVDPSFVLQGLRSVLDSRSLALFVDGRTAYNLGVSAEAFRGVAAALNLRMSNAELGSIGLLLLLLSALPKAETELHPAAIKTTDLFAAQLTHDWSLEELAQQVRMEPSYLARIFKASTTLPPMAYLNLLRVERASELLTSSSLSCAEVGQAVGWSDPNYFSRRFRQQYGVSPSSYRLQS